MKYFVLLFSMISIFTSAQLNRFIYEYRFVPNINEKDTIKKEMMALDIDEKGSTYQSIGKMAQDSSMKADISRAMATGGGNLNFKSNRRMMGGVNYKVTKEYPDFKTFLFERIGMDSYKIAEEEQLDWKIFPETQQIGEYKGQKATVDFGGRSWIAWFSSEIPFQDGPYKFHGLPGLIVKIEDITSSHVMTLVANKKINSTNSSDIKTPTGAVIIGMGGNEIPVSEKQFQKVYQDYLNDPAKNMRQMMGGNDPNRTVVIKMRSQDGKEISDMNEMARIIEKRTKNEEAKNNNRIEPTLFPKK